ncbi:hypothetical protein G6F68_020372 [Rhizopus microsporus]|nr:hypothetical protein G6F68_020372 [Rhizopus microsporus]
MFEADALQGVMQFDVHAQVVGVQLQLVAGAQAAVFRHIHGQRGDRAVERQAPVAVVLGLRPKIDPVDGAAHSVSPH